MIVKKVTPRSLAKFLSLYCGVLGTFAGAGATIASITGNLPKTAQAAPGFSFLLLFGPWSIITLPLFYAVCGYIGGFIGGYFYNFIANKVGGIEIEVA